VSRKTATAAKPCLVTTWTDGENGGWFRQIDEQAGFWGYFFAPYMEKVRAQQSPIRPITVSEFVTHQSPRSQVEVRTGAWNVGSTSGYDFSQWAGSSSQKKALEELYQLRRRHKDLGESLTGQRRPAAEDSLNRARELILKAETSCYLFWGDAWIPKLYEQTRLAHQVLDGIYS